MRMAYRLVAMQMLIAIMIAVLWLYHGPVSSISAILGGLAAVIPSLFFAYYFFAVNYARQAGRIIKAFYWGELIKLLSSAFLIVLIPKIWPQVELLPLIVGFAAACTAIGWTPLLERRR